MEILEIYLDGTQIFDWVNWDKLEQEITRVDAINSFTVQVTSKFTFSGDGYKLILDKLNELGPCASIPAKVIYRPSASSGSVLFNGVMFLNSITYDLEDSGVACSVEAEISDSSFSRAIAANKDAKFFIGEGIALDGTVYAGATPILLSMFDPNDNSLIPQKRRVYDVKDAIIDLVRAISDGTIEFSSTWYDGLPDDERYCLTTGLNIRGQGQQDPYVSFGEVVGDLQKKYNLWLFAAQINGINVLQLEQEDFITQSDEVVLKNVQGVKVSFDESKFYSTVNVGSQEFIKDQEGIRFSDGDPLQIFPLMSTFPYIPLITHVEETHNVSSTCSVGSALDLISELVICHNVIQDSLLNNNDEYDDNTFMIQYDQAAGRATSEELLGGTGLFIDARQWQYNGQVVNERVIDRWRFQADITNNFLQNIDKFSLETSLSSPFQADDFQWDPTPMDIDSPIPLFNDNNIWDTVAYEFIIPETGVYRFTGQLVWDIDANLTALIGDVASWAFEYTQGGVFVRKTNLALSTASGTGAAQSLDFVGRPAYLQKGNVCQWLNRIDWPSPAAGLTWRFRNSSGGINTEFELSDTVTAGDLTEPQSASTLFSQRMKFRHPIDTQTWIDMTQNPARTVVIENEVSNGTRTVAKGWPKNIKIDFVKGTAQWDLITNIEQKAFVP